MSLMLASMGGTVSTYTGKSYKRPNSTIHPWCLISNHSKVVFAQTFYSDPLVKTHLTHLTHLTTN